MQSAADVAELVGDAFPARAVAGRVSCERMGDFVQQHLMDLVVVISRSQISRDADAALLVIGEPGSSFCVIERETP